MVMLCEDKYDVFLIFDGYSGEIHKLNGIICGILYDRINEYILFLKFIVLIT